MAPSSPFKLSTKPKLAMHGAKAIAVHSLSAPLHHTCVLCAPSQQSSHHAHKGALQHFLSAVAAISRRLCHNIRVAATPVLEQHNRT